MNPIKRTAPATPTCSALRRPGHFSPWSIFLVTLFLLLGGERVKAQSFERFTYIVDTNNSITITGIDCSQGTAVIVPAMIAGLPVASIAASSAFGCLSRITIPSSVIQITYDVFGAGQGDNHPWVEVDPLNPSYTSVLGVLFDKDRTTIIQFPTGRLGSYTIPISVTRIGDGAFQSSELDRVTIPAGVTSIGDHACGRQDEIRVILAV